jgi:predicted hydrocarbon binding protein
MTNAIGAELTDDGAGRLSYRGARYLLIRPETLAALQHALEAALGAGAAECLAAGGRAGGGRAISSLTAHGGQLSASFTGAGRERVEALLATGSKIGWGRFALERFEPGELVVTVTGSPFADAYGTSRAPVCHLTRGVLEALGSAVLTGRPRVTETACVAMGAPACRFEAKAV